MSGGTSREMDAGTENNRWECHGKNEDGMPRGKAWDGAAVRKKTREANDTRKNKEEEHHKEMQMRGMPREKARERKRKECHRGKYGEIREHYRTQVRPSEKCPEWMRRVGVL